MSFKARFAALAAVLLLTPALFGQATPLPTAPPASRTMRLGIMAEGGNYYAPFAVYANRCKVGSPNWLDETGTYWGTARGGFDVDGMPRVASQNGLGKILADPTGDAWVSGGYPIAPEGRWTLMWDGPGHAWLNANWTHLDNFDPAQSTITGAADNIKVYLDVKALPGLHSPKIGLQVNKTKGPVRNLRVYDRYVLNPRSPPKFHPLALEKLAGTKLFRAKDWMGIDGGCPVVEFTDHTPTSTLSIHDHRQDGRVGITRFDPYSDAAYVRDREQGIKVTCAAPHGLTAGETVALHFPSPSPVPFEHALTHADGVVERVSWGGAMAFPVSATEFVVPGWFDSPIVGEALPAGAQVWRRWSGGPVSDAADLVNVLPDCGGWFSVPHAASDRYVTDLVTFLAKRIAAGRYVWVEYTNEPWNGAAPYPQYHYLRRMAREFGLARSGNPAWDVPDDIRARRWYVMRAGQIRELARVAWIAAGRDAADLGLVLNAQFVVGSRLLDFAADADLIDTQGRLATEAGYSGPIGFEGFAVAPYLEIPPAPDPDNQSVERVAAHAVAYVSGLASTPFGSVAKEHAANVAALRAKGRAVKLLCYEGGLSILSAGGAPQSQALRNVAAALHPSARGIATAYLSFFDRLKYDAMVWNGLAGTFVGEAGAVHCYSQYTGIEMVPGDGSANLPLITGPSGDPIPPDLSRAVSPIAAAVHAWTTPVVTPPAPQTDLDAELARLRQITANLAASSARLDAIAKQLQATKTSSETPHVDR